MKKPPENREASILTGRLPTLPHTCACSTIGAEELNYRVRDGNGWVLLAKVTQKARDTEYFDGSPPPGGRIRKAAFTAAAAACCVRSRDYGQAERAISNSQLSMLPHLH